MSAHDEEHCDLDHNNNDVLAHGTIPRSPVREDSPDAHATAAETKWSGCGGCFRAASLASTAMGAFFSGVMPKKKTKEAVEDRESKSPQPSDPTEGENTTATDIVSSSTLAESERQDSVTARTSANFHPGGGYEQLSDDSYTEHSPLNTGAASGTVTEAAVNRSFSTSPPTPQPAQPKPHQPTMDDIFSTAPLAPAPPQQQLNQEAEDEKKVTTLSKNGVIVMVEDGVEHTPESMNKRRQKKAKGQDQNGNKPHHAGVDHSEISSIGDLIRRVENVTANGNCCVRVEVSSNGVDATTGKELLAISIIGPVAVNAANVQLTHGSNGDAESVPDGMPQTSADILSEIESFLLDDLDEEKIELFMLNLYDLTTSATSGGSLLSTATKARLPSRGDLTAAASNPNVDNLDAIFGIATTSTSTQPPPPGASTSVASTFMGSTINHQSHAEASDEISGLVEDTKETHTNEIENVLLLVNHLMEYAPLTHLMFTRCAFQPSDFGTALHFPASTRSKDATMSKCLKHLSFSRCTLADAHLLALLRCGSSNDGGESQGNFPHLFTGLQHLHLSGTLSAETIANMLVHIIDQQDDLPPTDEDGEAIKVLGTVKVPPGLAERVRNQEELCMAVEGHRCPLTVNGKAVVPME